MNFKVLKEGMRDGIPIGLGYFAVSFAFGMMAASDGIDILPAVVISATNLTSAGQFAGLDVIFTDAGLIQMALTQFIINLRYSLMSFSISQKLDDGGNILHRFIVAFGVTDEIFGISASRPGRLSPYYNYGAMSVAIPGWVLGTLGGAVMGNVLPDVLLSALSVALYGMFLAIIIPPARDSFAVMSVVIAAMALSTAFSLVPFLTSFSYGSMIIIVTVLVSSVAAGLMPIEEEEL